MLEVDVRVQGGRFHSGKPDAIVVALLALFLCAVAVEPILACSPEIGLTPANFTPLFVAEGRIGNNRMVPGHAYGTHEFAILDPALSSWSFHEIGQYVWSSGTPTAFEIEYAPSSSIARFTIAGVTSAWHVVAHTPTSSLSVVFGVRSVRAASRIRLHDITINDQPVDVDITASVTSQTSVLSGLISAGSNVPVQIHGWVTMTFPTGPGRPHNNQLQFLVFVGKATDVASSTDGDGDGLPDAWEEQYFGDPANCDPEHDDDGDGASNQDEYEADTNPGDPNSNLQIAIKTTIATNDSPSRSGPSNAVVVPVVQWPASSNRTYSVWRANTLRSGMDGFTLLAAGIPGTPPYNMFEDTTATGPGPYYYRVKVHLAP